MSDKHTHEPWRVSPIGSTIRAKRRHICERGREYIFPNSTVAKLPVSPNRRGDGRRIVAAVNGCTGIPTEALEAGVVADMLEALKAVRAVLAEREPQPLPALAKVLAAIAKAEGAA